MDLSDSEKEIASQHQHIIKLRNPGNDEPLDSSDFCFASGRILGILIDEINLARKELKNQFSQLRDATAYQKHPVEAARGRYKEDVATRQKEVPLRVHRSASHEDRLANLNRVASELRHDIVSIFNKSFAPTDRGIERSPFVREHYEELPTPLSWFQELRTTYRGDDRTFTDAILVLSYICMCYRTPGIMANPLLHIRKEELEDSLDLREERRKAIMRYLRSEGVIKTIIVQGLSPWYSKEDKTSGNWLFAFPRPARLRQITYSCLERTKHLKSRRLQGGVSNVVTTYADKEPEDQRSDAVRYGKPKLF